MSESTMIQCPSCAGTGKISGLARMVSGPCQVVTLNCFDCKGAGEITEEQSGWKTLGDVLRQDRLSHDRSLGEEARRRGMRPVDLADMEQGRSEPIRDMAEYDG